MQALVLVCWVRDCLSIFRLETVEVTCQGDKQEINLCVEFRDFFIEVLCDGSSTNDATDSLGTESCASVSLLRFS